MPTAADAALRGRIAFLGSVLLAIFLVGWTAYFYPYDDLFDRSGTQLGGDFPVFYTMARLADAGRWRELYDFDAQGAEIRAFLPGFPKDKFLPALYPPYVPVCLAPLAKLPYPWAFAAFATVSIGLLTGMLALWSRSLRIMQTSWRNTVILAVATAPAILETLVSGQAAILATTIFGTAGALALAGRPRLAGAVLAFAAYKPNVLAIAGLGLLIRWPRMWIGFAPTTVALVALGAAVAGPEVYADYWRTMTSADAGGAIGMPPAHKFPTFASSTPWSADARVLKVVCLSACAAGAAFLGWRGKSRASTPGSDALLLAACGMLTLLGNPYLPIYDVALAVPTAAFLAEGLGQRYGFSIAGRVLAAHLLFAYVYFGPHLSQAARTTTGFHPWTWALPFLAVWVGTVLLGKSSGDRAATTQSVHGDRGDSSG